MAVRPSEGQRAFAASVKRLFGLPPTAPCQLYTAEGIAVTMSGRLMPDRYTLHVADERPSASLGHEGEPPSTHTQTQTHTHARARVAYTHGARVP